MEFEMWNLTKCGLLEYNQWLKMNLFEVKFLGIAEKQNSVPQAKKYINISNKKHVRIGKLSSFGILNE